MSRPSVAEFKEKMDKCPPKNIDLRGFDKAVFCTLFCDDLEPSRGRM